MINVTSPYDGHLIRSIPQTSEEEIEQIIERAHAAFEDKKNWLTPSDRVTILENVYKIMQVKSMELALLASEEGGKPLVDSKVEVARALDGIQIAKNNIYQLQGEEIPMQLNNLSLHKRAYTHREPVGVVYAICAFNHPINLVIHQAITAIAVGCPVIIKPSRTTPLSCLTIMKILYDSGLPEQWCQAVVCGNILAEKIVTDPRVKYFSFIGSSNVGWYLRSKLSPGTKCVLEHGGAAPVIVEHDADIESAIPGIVKGGYYHAGQVCVSVQRIYVHDKIIKKFNKILVEQINNLIVGDPLLETTQVGPLVSESSLKNLEENVKQAKYDGGKILIGGNRIHNTCFEPTLILNPPDTTIISKQEIFGPVVCVFSYTDLSDAIRLANNLPYQFQSSIYTKNIDVAWRAIRELKANTVLVNEQTSFRVDWMPFGGQDESGIGIGGIPFSMQDMTYPKLAIWHSENL